MNRPTMTHRTTPARTLGRAALLSVALALMLGPVLRAAPQNPTVVHGNADFATAGDTTTITAGHNAVIDYRSFNIAGHETVRFVQPSASARVLNRVLDGNVTQIHGRLLSNGHVYIANPAGIYFGNTAVVNVGAITAAAGNIATTDFLDQADRFTDIDGAILNEGSITAAAVRLLGNHVANRGQIVAPEGMVAMTAGESVYLADLGAGSGLMIEVSGGDDAAVPEGQHAVENTGLIDAPGGGVSFAASDVYTLAARQGGEVQADSVAIDAPAGRTTLDGATLADAAVDVAGEHVRQSGHVRAGADAGGAIAIRATRTYHATADATLDASGLGQGNGGSVVVFSDGSTAFNGRAYARSGGFVELSAVGRLDLGPDAVIDTAGGSLLLDPKNVIVTVELPNGAGDPDAGFDDDPGLDSYLTPAQLVAALAANSLTLQANNDITIDDAIDASGGVGDLTLEAGRSILINASLDLPGSFYASANAVRFEGVVDAHRDAGPAEIRMAAETSITAAGDIEFWLEGGWGLTHFQSGDIELGDLMSSNADVEIHHEGRSPDGAVLLSGLIDAPNGDIDINAGLDLPGKTAATGILIATGLFTDTGDIDLFSTAGITVDAFAEVNTIGGDIDIEAGGAFAMGDGSYIASDSGMVDLYAFGDVTLHELYSGYPDNPVHSAISVVSASGSINDTGGFVLQDLGVSEQFSASEVYGGEGGVAINAPNGEALLVAPAGGIGDGENPLDVDVTRLTAWTNGGDQYLAVHRDLDAFDLDAATGHIDLSTPFGANLNDTDGMYDIIADTVSLDIDGDLGSASPLADVDAGNTNAVDLLVASPGGSTFGVTGTDNSIINASPIDVTVTTTPPDGEAFIVSTTGSVTIDADVTIDQASTDAPIEVTADGTITVNNPLTNATDGDRILLGGKGGINVNASLNASGVDSRIDLIAFGPVAFAADADASVPDGVLGIVVDPANRTGGGLTMADTGSDVTTFDVGNDIDIVTVGSIQLGRLLAGGAHEDTVTIESLSGAITDAGETEGSNLVVPGGGVELTAQTGIGATDELETEIAQLEAWNNQSGDIRINEADDLSIDHIQNAGATTRVTAGGSIGVDDDSVIHDGGTIEFVADDDLTLDGPVAFADTVVLHAGFDGTGTLAWAAGDEVVAADTIELIAGDGPGGDETGAVDLSTHMPFFVANDAVTTTAPTTLTIMQDAPLALDMVAFADALGFGDGGDAEVTLQSRAGGIDLDAASPATTTATLRLIASADVDLAGEVSVDTLNAEADGDILMTGDARYGATNTIDLDAGGDVELAELTSDSELATAIRVEAGGAIRNIATDVEATNLDAPDGGADLAAQSGIGEQGIPITTALAELAFRTDGGGAFIRNDNAGTLLSLGSSSFEHPTGTFGGGSTSVVNASPLTIAADYTFEGPATLEAGGNAADPGDHLTVLPGVTVTLDSTNGDQLELIAGDEVRLPSTSLVLATGSDENRLGFIADFDPDPDGDANPGIFVLGGEVVGPIIEVRSPEMQYDGGSLDAGPTGRVTLTGFDVDEPMTLGEPHDPETLDLEISASFIDAITADRLELGDGVTGPIFVSQTIAPPNVNTILLTSGDAITSDPAAFIVAPSVAAVAENGVQINTDTGAETLAAQTSAGDIEIVNVGPVTIGAVAGVTGLSTADGGIDLTTIATGPGEQAAQNGTGDILQAADAPLTATSASSFTVPDGSSILLTDAANDLVGGVAFAAATGNVDTIAFVNNAPIAIGDKTITGNLIVDAPTVQLTGDYGSTGGSMIFDANIELLADVVVSGRNVTFNRFINSDSTESKRRLDVNTFGEGLTTFNAPVGAGLDGVSQNGGGDDRPLEHLGTNADGTTIFNTPIILVDGPASAEFDNAARVSQDLEITELGGGPVTFGGPVDASPGANASLTVNTSGPTNFGGPVGGSQPLQSITTDPPGNTTLSNNVTTTGPQTFNDVVESTQPVTLTGEQVTLGGGKAPTSDVININTVAFAADTPNLAEVLPGEEGGEDQTAAAGPTSDLAAALTDAGIDVPAAMRDTGADRRLQNAVDDFLLTLDLDAAFTANGFVNFLGRPNQRAAAATLIAVRDTLDRIDDADLDDDRKQALRRRVIDEMRPTGVSRDEFEAILEALPRAGGVAVRG